MGAVNQTIDWCGHTVYQAIATGRQALHQTGDQAISTALDRQLGWTAL
jgi:hypothetical protein